MRRVRRHLTLQFLGDKGNRCQRRSQFVGGGGGQAIERRQTLLPRQHDFSGPQGRRHLPGFFGNAPGINRREDRAADNREPQPGEIVGWQLQGLARRPGQRQMIEGQRRGAAEAQGAQRQR